MFVGSALGVKRYPGRRAHGAGLDRAAVAQLSAPAGRLGPPPAPRL